MNSKHLCETSIPNDLDIGEHAIEVKAVDMFGRDYKQIA